MDRKECVEIIEFECIDMDGFLIRLRARKFSRKNYENLKNALHLYRELIRGEDTIDRSIAYCLHFLDLGMISATEHFSRTKEDELLIHRINAELSILVEEILTPEHMIQ